jgi:hypothetical protein
LSDNANIDLKGKNAKAIRAQMTALAGTLADFNEGDIGPGQCDEPLVIVDNVAVSGAPLLLAPIGLLAPITGWLRRRIQR